VFIVPLHASEKLAEKKDTLDHEIAVYKAEISPFINSQSFNKDKRYESTIALSRQLLSQKIILASLNPKNDQDKIIGVAQAIGICLDNYQDKVGANSIFVVSQAFKNLKKTCVDIDKTF
jgi:hypothetical protein